MLLIIKDPYHKHVRIYVFLKFLTFNRSMDLEHGTRACELIFRSLRSTLYCDPNETTSGKVREYCRAGSDLKDKIGN